jgi:hypothetical protein
MVFKMSKYIEWLECVVAKKRAELAQLIRELMAIQKKGVNKKRGFVQ